jgi:hypothetical protein
MSSNSRLSKEQWSLTLFLMFTLRISFYNTILSVIVNIFPRKLVLFLDTGVINLSALPLMILLCVSLSVQEIDNPWEPLAWEVEWISHLQGGNFCVKEVDKTQNERLFRRNLRQNFAKNLKGSKCVIFVSSSKLKKYPCKSFRTFL